MSKVDQISKPLPRRSSFFLTAKGSNVMISEDASQRAATLLTGKSKATSITANGLKNELSLNGEPELRSINAKRTSGSTNIPLNNVTSKDPHDKTKLPLRRDFSTTSNIVSSRRSIGSQLGENEYISKCCDSDYRLDIKENLVNQSIHNNENPRKIFKKEDDLTATVSSVEKNIDLRIETVIKIPQTPSTAKWSLVQRCDGLKFPASTMKMHLFKNYWIQILEMTSGNALEIMSSQLMNEDFYLTSSLLNIHNYSDICAMLTIENFPSNAERFAFLDHSEWFCNNFRWVLWTLTSYERTQPFRFSQKLLTANNILSPVFLRYYAYVGKIEEFKRLEEISNCKYRSKFNRKVSMSPLQVF